MMDEEKKRKMKQAGVVAAFAAALFIAMLAWNGSITGFHSLETFETDVFVSGSSPENSLGFEKIPNFIAKAGEEVNFKVIANRDDVFFSDNSRFFEIRDDGVVDFVPRIEDAGKHNVWIIITDSQNHYYYQNVVIVIEE